MKSRVFIAMEMMLHTPTPSNSIAASFVFRRWPFADVALLARASPIEISIPNPFSSLRHQLVINDLDKIRAYLW
jgi:hypothetical protein